MTRSGLRNKLLGMSEGSDPTRPPEAELMDTVARYGCFAAVVVSPGGRHVKRGSAGTRGEVNHADWTGWSTDRTLWVTGLVSGLSTSV